MSKEFKLPEIAEGVDEGEVTEVYVAEGDEIAIDDPVLELEVSKGVVPVPSNIAGKVVKVHVREGDTAKVGGVLLTIETNGGAPAQTPAAEAEPAEEPAPEPAEEPAPTPEPTPEPASETPPEAAPTPPPVRQPVQAPPAPVAARPSETSDRNQVAAGPETRRFAREVGIDLSTIQGSGLGGRILREDVVAAVRAASQGTVAPRPGVSEAKSSGASKEIDAEESSERDRWGPVRIEKLPRIRKTIAQQMHKSWSTAPRVTNFDDADVTELELVRQSAKDDYARKGIKLTSMPFVIKAVAMALRKNPSINAAIDIENSKIIYKEYVNIGIAVDTERGLVVPSLRAADEKSVPDLARELAKIAENMRNGDFGLDDLQGSTFTISNMGAIGGSYSTPIINVPEVAILLLGRSRKMPVVVNDEISPRLMMPLSLSYDHRMVDGAVAARFLNDVIDLLSAPSRLLLAP